MNDLQIINISGVDCYEKDGTVYLKLEAVARGLGFTRIAASGNEVVRWETIRKYLSEFGVPTSWHGEPKGREGLPEYIPENVFYRLAMKAKNEAAEAFQAKIADEVIPSIRKHGAYMAGDTLDRMIASPEFGIKLLTELQAERDKRRELEATVEVQKQAIADFAPTQQYVDTILSSLRTMTTTQIAADYDLTANRLNKILHDEGVQRKVGGQWVLYQKHMGKGYTKSRTIPIKRSDGRDDSVVQTEWTQKGRMMIHDILTRRGISAVMDRAESA